MEPNLSKKRLAQWMKLLRWDKPSGRMILLIPAGWSLWLTPNAPPTTNLIFLIISGGIFISGAGCIANDLWDKKFDSKVERTKERPLAAGTVKVSTGYILLFLMLSFSLMVVMFLPANGRFLSIALSIAALPIILIYPSAKRWMKFPQALLALCWGFAVLIPWAASQSSLSGGTPLLCCWLATMLWTFGFDTVYAMSDQQDDKVLGLNSSVLSLGKNANPIVAISYLITCILIGIAAITVKVNLIFWPIWLIVSVGMQIEAFILKSINLPKSSYGKHFKNQVLLGSLLLFGLILGRIN